MLVAVPSCGISAQRINFSTFGLGNREGPVRWILDAWAFRARPCCAVHEAGHCGVDFERRKIEGAALFGDVPFLISIGLAISDF